MEFQLGLGEALALHVGVEVEVCEEEKHGGGVPDETVLHPERERALDIEGIDGVGHAEAELDLVGGRRLEIVISQKTRSYIRSHGTNNPK